MKIDLSRVTLVCYENRDHERALELMHQQCLIARFGAVRLLNWFQGYRQFVYWENFEMWKYITTEFVMSIHLDGFIINPSLWREKWLEYDFIGAPWRPPVNRDRVGNGGFCIKSRRFINRIAQFEPVDDLASDTLVCSHYRQKMIDEGFTYAPPEEAAVFSREEVCDETPEKSFGFHGKFNMGLVKDSELDILLKQK